MVGKSFKIYFGLCKTLPRFAVGVGGFNSTSLVRRAETPNKLISRVEATTCLLLIDSRIAFAEILPSFTSYGLTPRK
jgi:hypothetical protein